MSNLLATLKKLGFEIDHRSHPTLYLEGDGKLFILSISDEETGNEPTDDTRKFHIQGIAEDINGNELGDRFYSKGTQ